MKFFLAVISIALIIQVSLTNNDPKAFYKSTKGLVGKLIPMIKAVLKDMPNTAAYSKYRNELGYFLDFLEDKSRKQPCFFKTFGIMNDFVELITPYEKDNAAAEAKAVYKLFNKHGFMDLDKEIIKVALTYELDKLGSDLEKLANSNDALLSEVC